MKMVSKKATAVADMLPERFPLAAGCCHSKQIVMDVGNVLSFS